MFLRLGGLLFVVGLVVWLWAIFDAVTTERTRVRNLPKLAWILVILLFNWAGAVAWAFLGRPRNDGAPTRVSGSPFFGGNAGGVHNGGPSRSGRPGPTTRRPIGPDDDPDFLGKI